MKDFRSETFIQFILTTKPIWFLKTIWVFAFIFLGGMFFWMYKTDSPALWGYFLFIIVGLIVQSGFIYWMSFRMYHLGRQALLQLNNEDVQIVTDIGVYIKGFDIFSKKTFWNIDINNPIYDFNEADIIFSRGSLILLGKTKQFGGTSLASPVEIVTTNPITTIANAKLINWFDNGNRVQIEIDDNNYPKPIKIEFKNNYEEIKSWLIRNCQMRS